MDKLTIKEAAEYYGRSKSWIRKKILAGELKAEKEGFKYGKRWVTTSKALDDLEKKLQEQAKTENEVINVREVNKPVNKKEFMNELMQATQEQNEKLANNIIDKLEQQNKTIEKLTEKVEDLQEKQNRSFIDKIKDFFK